MTVGIGTGGGLTTPSEEELAEYEQERPARRIRPALDLAISVWCAIISVGVLAQVFFPLPQGTQFYLVIFLAAVLPITLLCYRGWKVPAFLNPLRGRSHDDPGIMDWILAAVAFAVCIYPLLDFDGYLERRQTPTGLDVVAGAVLLILLLEACRRTTGWVLPVFSLVFIAYAYYGGYLPYTWSLAHQGFNFDAIIAQFAMGTAGFYGTPLSVAASYIVLFTIYGAVLDYSGAGKFFIDLSFAAFNRATASETGASVQNVQGLVAGNYDIAFSLGDTAADAVKGVKSFKVPQDVAALTRLYNNYTQVAVRTSAGINSIADLKGKRVSTGSPNSGTEVIARRLLEAAGLDPAKDVTAQRLGLPESVDAMKSGSIDALVWSGGLPTGGITDLTTSMGKNVKLLPIVDLLPKMQEKYGTVYTQAPIPAATYKQPADVATIVVPNVLLVRKNMKDDLAEQLTKVVYDNMDALVAVNVAAKGITLENADKTDPVPLHPGAKKAIDGLK